MKTSLVIFLLIKLKSVHSLESVTTSDSDVLDIIKHQEEILRDITSIVDAGVSLDSDNNIMFGTTENIEEEEFKTSTQDTSTTTTVPTTSVTQYFTSDDVPSFKTSNTISKKSYQVMTATKGYSKTTRHTTTASSVTKTSRSTTTTTSTTSWWLSRLWKKTRKSTSSSTVSTTTHIISRTPSTLQETSTPGQTEPEGTNTPLLASSEQNTALPREIDVGGSSTVANTFASSVMTSSETSSETVSSSTITTTKASSLSSSQGPSVRTESYSDTSYTTTELVTSSEPLIELSDSSTEAEPAVTERTVVYKVYSSEKVLYLVAVITPSILLPLLLLLLWLYLRRRSVWGRGEEEKKFPGGPEGERLMTMIPGARQSVIFLVPGQSLPNISLELKDEIHYNSMADLSSSSRGDSPKQTLDTDCSRKRWQSDGNEVDECCRDSLLTERGKWKSEDWEKDQSFMTMLARRLEMVDSKAEITEL